MTKARIWFLAGLYGEIIDRSLLLTGTLLHDFAKEKARRQLRRTLDLRHLPTDLDDAADIVRPRADGAGIVPDLQIDHAGAVGQNAG